MNACIINSPIGGVRLQIDQGAVTQVDFQWQSFEEKEGVRESLLRQVERSIIHYFQSPTSLQSIPCRPSGTPFQQKVWQALRQIPLGGVATYGELAAQLGSSPRAVGGACRNNPIPLLIPCHRVVSKTGVGGFSGEWGEGERVETKRWLLRHEGVTRPS